MLRVLGVLVVALAGWLSLATHAHACKIPNTSVFTLSDEADVVMVTHVLSVTQPANGRLGRARLVVTEGLRGIGAGDRFTLRFGNSSCDPRVRKTRKSVLVFARADGTLMLKYLGYVTEPDEALLTALREWSAATTAEDRIDVLVDAMTGPDERIGWNAANAAASPALQATLDDAQRERLAEAVATFRAAHVP
jgi:hypothetical protein